MYNTFLNPYLPNKKDGKKVLCLHIFPSRFSYCFSYYVPLPKITKDLYRVFCFRFKENCPETWDIEKVLSYFTNGVYETKILEDIALGNIFIVDCTNISLGHVTRITPTLIKKLNTLTEKVYNDRQKATHLIYNGTGADILMAMLKSAMRAKVRERVRETNSFCYVYCQSLSSN